VYGANNEDLSPVPSASNTKVVALKMYDPQLHDHLTTPGKAALSRWYIHTYNNNEVSDSYNLVVFGFIIGCWFGLADESGKS